MRTIAQDREKARTIPQAHTGRIPLALCMEGELGLKQGLVRRAHRVRLLRPASPPALPDVRREKTEDEDGSDDGDPGGDEASDGQAFEEPVLRQGEQHGLADLVGDGGGGAERFLGALANRVG